MITLVTCKYLELMLVGIQKATPAYLVLVKLRRTTPTKPNFHLAT